jgi:hypothetical protein
MPLTSWQHRYDALPSRVSSCNGSTDYSDGGTRNTQSISRREKRIVASGESLASQESPAQRRKEGNEKCKTENEKCKTQTLLPPSVHKCSRASAIPAWQVNQAESLHFAFCILGFAFFILRISLRSLNRCVKLFLTHREGWAKQPAARNE